MQQPADTKKLAARESALGRTTRVVGEYPVLAPLFAPMIASWLPALLAPSASCAPSVQQGAPMAKAHAVPAGRRGAWMATERAKAVSAVCVELEERVELRLLPTPRSRGAVANHSCPLARPWSPNRRSIGGTGHRAVRAKRSLRRSALLRRAICRRPQSGVDCLPTSRPS